MSAFKDLTGQKFERLIVICPTKKRSSAHVIWLCKCNCGNLTEVSSDSLQSGNTKSCGCLQKERTMNNKFGFKHGDATYAGMLRLYRIWKNISQRCYNKNQPAYKYYGGRGITICDEWRNYENFKNWALVTGYADNLTIDRINNDGNYEPTNCHWITQSENSKKPKHKYEKTND